jgi:hypothetical protein
MTPTKMELDSDFIQYQIEELKKYMKVIHHAACMSMRHGSNKAVQKHRSHLIRLNDRIAQLTRKKETTA